MCVTKNLNHYTSARVFFFFISVFPSFTFLLIGFRAAGKRGKRDNYEQGWGVASSSAGQGVSLSLSPVAEKPPKKEKRKEHHHHQDVDSYYSPPGWKMK